MGQKTHPKGFRVGIIRPWDSTWYANFKDYAANVAEDAKIRKFIKNAPILFWDHSVRAFCTQYRQAVCTNTHHNIILPQNYK